MRRTMHIFSLLSGPIESQCFEPELDLLDMTHHKYQANVGGLLLSFEIYSCPYSVICQKIPVPI